MTAPNPVTNRQFTDAFAKALHRPAKLPLPLPVASALFTREMVQDAMLASQRALPTVLLESGFEFTQPEIDQAMAAVN